MLISRCAWHRMYRGYVKFLGVVSWQGWSVQFTDGMCRGCAQRLREDWRASRRIGHPAYRARMSVLTPRRHAAIVAMSVLVALVLAAGHLHDGSLADPSAAPRLSGPARGAARAARPAGSAAALARGPRLACAYGETAAPASLRVSGARHAALAAPPSPSYTTAPAWASRAVSRTTRASVAVASWAPAYAPVVVYAARGSDFQAP